MTSAPPTISAPVPGVSPDIYSQADFQAIAGMVHGEAGIVLPPGKAMMVYSRVAPLVRESDSSTFRDFLFASRNDAAARRRIIDALTTNHTFFFRERHHFEHFTQVVRPLLLARVDQGGPARLWSAGCSSGEETWSLVLSLLGEDAAAGQRLARHDIRVLASDLAEHVLHRAQAARYAAADVRDVPAELRAAWLEDHDGVISVCKVARDLVRFRVLNLLGDWPMQQPFDVIFCRNVMIYFDQPTKERLLARFVGQLRSGGHLYIGHSERVTGPAAAGLELVGPTIYRKSAQ